MDFGFRCGEIKRSVVASDTVLVGCYDTSTEVFTCMAIPSCVATSMAAYVRVTTQPNKKQFEKFLAQIFRIASMELSASAFS